ncbi:Os05g0414400, partial [Oryza sativa Japonica Group]
AQPPPPPPRCQSQLAAGNREELGASMGEPSVARSKDCDMEYDDSSSRQSGEPLWEHAEGVERSVDYSDGLPPTSKGMFQSNKRKSKAADEDLHMKLRTRLDAEVARMFYSSGLSLKAATDPFFKSAFSRATSMPGFTAEEDEHQDDQPSLVTQMFFSIGLSPTITRNPYYRGSFAMVALFQIPGYVPPGVDQLKTTLLQKERADIENMLQTIKNTWRKAGVTIVSDGWSDFKRRPIINIIAVNEAGPVFLQAINNEDGWMWMMDDYIAEKLIAAIEDVGSENVVQVITDNDPFCRAAGVLIEQKYSHIQWTPSVAHSLSLALENICAAKNAENVVFKDCHWISEVIGDAKMINDFISNHSMVLSMISEFSKLKILGIAHTRFASDIVMLKRFRFD